MLETAATFIGFRYFLYLRKKHTDSIPGDNRIAIFIGAIFGALTGSRLIGGLEHPELLQSSSYVLLHFYENKTILGGLLGGLVGVEISKKIIGERRSSGDLFTYPLILAMIIGRIGCFSMGIHEETYGTETTLFTGIDVGDGRLRHPVTLYEIGFLIFLWTTLVRVEKHIVLSAGTRFKIFLVCYLLFRLLLDYIKPRHIVFTGLSTIQLTSIAGLIYYTIILLKPPKQKIAYG